MVKKVGSVDYRDLIKARPMGGRQVRSNLADEFNKRLTPSELAAKFPKKETPATARPGGGSGGSGSSSGISDAQSGYDYKSGRTSYDNYTADNEATYKPPSGKSPSGNSGIPQNYTKPGPTPGRPAPRPTPANRQYSSRGAVQTLPKGADPGSADMAPNSPATRPGSPGARVTSAAGAPTNKVPGGGFNRQKFAKEITPAVKRKMQIMSLAENRGSREGNMAVLETMFNRRDAYNGIKGKPQSMDGIVSSRYYQPWTDGGYKAAEKIYNNMTPEQRAELDKRWDEVVDGGSNYSDFATDNASGSVARSAEKSQTVGARLSGETYSRKDKNPREHGALIVKKTKEWYAKTKEAVEAAKSGGGGSGKQQYGNNAAITNSMPVNEPPPGFQPPTPQPRNQQQASSGKRNYSSPLPNHDDWKDPEKLAGVKSAVGEKTPGQRRGFMADRSFRSNSPRLHAGNDYFGKAGDSVSVTEDGVVLDASNHGGYGGTVDVLHTAPDGSKYVTRYGHLNNKYPVKVGDKVKAGQEIGSLNGDNHLHMEVRDYEAYKKNPFAKLRPGMSREDAEKMGIYDPSDYFSGNGRFKHLAPDNASNAGAAPRPAASAPSAPGAGTVYPSMTDPEVRDYQTKSANGSSREAGQPTWGVAHQTGMQNMADQLKWMKGQHPTVRNDDHLGYSAVFDGKQWVYASDPGKYRTAHVKGNVDGKNVNNNSRGFAHIGNWTPEHEKMLMENLPEFLARSNLTTDQITTHADMIRAGSGSKSNQGNRFRLNMEGGKGEASAMSQFIMDNKEEIDRRVQALKNDPEKMELLRQKFEGTDKDGNPIDVSKLTQAPPPGPPPAAPPSTEPPPKLAPMPMEQRGLTSHAERMAKEANGAAKSVEAETKNLVAGAPSTGGSNAPQAPQAAPQAPDAGAAPQASPGLTNSPAAPTPLKGTGNDGAPDASNLIGKAGAQSDKGGVGNEAGTSPLVPVTKTPGQGFEGGTVPGREAQKRIDAAGGAEKYMAGDKGGGAAKAAPTPKAAPAAKAPAPKMSAPKATPKMASGGSVRGASEEISMHDSRSGRKLGEVSRGENIRFDHSGKAQVTPARRIDPRSLEKEREERIGNTMRAADKKKHDEHVPTSKRPQPPNNVPSNDFAGREQWGKQPTNASFARAMRQANGRRSESPYGGNRFGEDQRSDII
jgi:hypothetical protein